MKVTVMLPLWAILGTAGLAAIVLAASLARRKKSFKSGSVHTTGIILGYSNGGASGSSQRAKVQFLEDGEVAYGYSQSIPGIKLKHKPEVGSEVAITYRRRRTLGMDTLELRIDNL